MEGRGGPAAAALSDPPSPSHVLDPVFTPVRSPDDDHPEIYALPSDDDHGQGQDHSVGAGVLTYDLKHKIVKQVEYFFSDENLRTDNYMMSFIKKNQEGFVPIAVIASFRKMKKLTRDCTLIVAALRASSFFVVSPDGRSVKRLYPLPFTEVRDPKLLTVLVENLPEDHSVENIQRIFGEAGNIKNIYICDPHAVEESTKDGKPDMLISSKLHVLVKYETVEAAEKAVATLNNEDWRNGMRVKLLKRVYEQRRQAWRGSDSENNGTSRGSDHTGDEENHSLSEHHVDTPDEEDGEDLSKEKIGHRGQNRGKSKRHNYSGGNGLGHGSTWSTHAIETPKPPPGPRMPDGTRGFAMGRGRPPIRPPISNQTDRDDDVAIPNSPLADEPLSPLKSSTADEATKKIFQEHMEETFIAADPLFGAEQSIEEQADSELKEIRNQFDNEFGYSERASYFYEFGRSRQDFRGYHIPCEAAPLLIKLFEKHGDLAADFKLKGAIGDYVFELLCAVLMDMDRIQQKDLRVHKIFDWRNAFKEMEAVGFRVEGLLAHLRGMVDSVFAKPKEKELEELDALIADLQKRRDRLAAAASLLAGSAFTRLFS